MTEEQPQPEPQPEDEQQPDLAHADVGVVCALAREMAFFFDGCQKVRKYTGGKFTFRGGRFGEIRVACAESGMGFAKARAATQALIEGHTPPWVLSCGYSGALRDGMKVGDIVMADAICDTHGHELKVDLHMSTEGQKGLHVGRFVTSDEMVRLAADKKTLGEKYDAIAVDMESLAVAQVCKETGTPFLAVRVVSDKVTTDLPKEIVSVLGETGTFRVGATMGAIWKRFGSIKDMWRLREQTNTASDRLAKFLQGVVVQLHEAGGDSQETEEGEETE